MNYDNMCLGSETLDAGSTSDILHRMNTRLCRVCDSWVSTGVPTSRLVPVHEKPYTDAEERRFERNAASVIRSEFRQAREKGRLFVDPYRSHLTALRTARPRKHMKGGE